MEKTLNEKVFYSTRNVSKVIPNFLKEMTHNFLESSISERYIQKEIEKECLTTSYNWWLGYNNGKNYAIHIDKSLQPIDKTFAKELEKANYTVIFVYINELMKKIYFRCDVYDTKWYELEEFIKLLKLKPKEKQPVKNIQKEKENKIDKKIYDWLIENMDYKDFIYNSILQEEFLTKFFEYIINLDIVWANSDNLGNLNFFIGEIKFKSKNKNNMFLMNVGERNRYLNILEKTNIKVFALSLIAKRDEKEKTILEIMENKKFPLFSCELTKENLEKLGTKAGTLSQKSLLNGQSYQKVVEIPFQNFQRIFSFMELGYKPQSFVKTLNIILQEKVFTNKESITEKHIAKYLAICKLLNEGYDIDYIPLFDKNTYKNILTINNKKILFKYVDSKKSWNLTIEDYELKQADEEKIDYIIVYRKKSEEALKIKETKDEEKSWFFIDEENDDNAIEVLGYIEYETFKKYCHKLPANIPRTQKNFYACKGMKNYSINKNAKGIKTDNEVYFLQVIGWVRDNFDKEPDECLLKTDYPFLSNYKNM